MADPSNPAASPVHDSARRVALVLGGGNGLGAYLAGAYEQLDRAGIGLDWIVGSSIGAVTGAILAGNAPEERLGKLAEFWAEATLHTGAAPLRHGRFRQIYNGVHTAATMLLGRPNIFRGRYPGAWSILPWMPDDVALYDLAPLRCALERLVDFDRLNRAEVRYTAAAVDVETGEEVYFDNTRQRLGPEHVVASASIMPTYPPTAIDGRLYCDPGYTTNLPVDVPFHEQGEGDLLCIGVELFSPRGPRPTSLDAATERAHDLVFASAPRRTIEALRREHALHEQLRPDGPRATLLHVAYQAAGDELAGKTFDYSPSSIADRRAAGRRDMASGLALLGRAGREGARFHYLRVEPDLAATHAEAGAASEAGPALGRAA